MKRMIILKTLVPIAALTMAIPSIHAAPKRDRDIVACTSAKDSQAKIYGCQKALERRNLTSQLRHDLLLQRGFSYTLLGQYQPGLADFNSALSINPRSVLALAYRSEVFVRMGDSDRALQDADEAIRANPKVVNGHNARGMALMQRGEFDRAVDAYNKGLDIDRNSVHLLVGRSNAWLAKAEPDRSIADLDRAIKLNPNIWQLYHNRCSAWTLKNEIDQALADCNQALKRNPEATGTLMSRAGLYLRKGALDESLADYTRAVRLNPDSAIAYAGRGEVWRVKGELVRALADLDHAIKLNPRSVGAHLYRGLVSESLGEIDNARQSFRSAIELPAVTMEVEDQHSLVRTSKRWQDAARARLAALDRADSGPTGPLMASAPTQKSSGIAPTPLERRVALIIGNGAYTSASRLVNPPNDAHAIAKNLRGMGFEVSEGIDLDRAAMRARLDDFIRAAATARVAVLFYAGHGVQIDGQNYLLPVDARLDGSAKLADEVMDVDSILAGLDDTIRANIVILDACRDNPLKTMQVASAEGGRSVSVRSGLAAPSGLGKGATTGAGTLLAFATAPGQVALDGSGENSPFSTALSRHISTPGLEVQQMLTRVRAEVVAATKSRQVPWSNSALLGEVYLAGKP